MYYRPNVGQWAQAVPAAVQIFGGLFGKKKKSPPTREANARRAMAVFQPFSEWFSEGDWATLGNFMNDRMQGYIGNVELTLMPQIIGKFPSDIAMQLNNAVQAASPAAIIPKVKGQGTWIGIQQAVAIAAKMAARNPPSTALRGQQQMGVFDLSSILPWFIAGGAVGLAALYLGEGRPTRGGRS